MFSYDESGTEQKTSFPVETAPTSNQFTHKQDLYRAFYEA